MFPPTLQPNMREMVLVVQATLQWHSMGEKHSTFCMSAPGHLAVSRLLRERCQLLPRRPAPAVAPPAPPASPPPPPLLLLLLPALTIRPHSSHRSIAAGRKRLPELFLHSGRTSPLLRPLLSLLLLVVEYIPLPLDLLSGFASTPLSLVLLFSSSLSTLTE